MNKTLKVISILLVTLGVFLIVFQIGLSKKDIKEDKDIVNEFISEKEYYEIDTSQTDEKKQFTEFSINWTKLKNINPDVIAWIRIPNTNINYPVLQGESNNTYLRHNIYHRYSRSGCIFVSEDNSNPFVDFNTIVYGHNMQNGQMFSDLKKYREQDFYEDHKYVYIYFPDESVKKYNIISFHVVNDGDPDVYTLNVREFNSYKKAIFKNNILNNVFEDIENVESVITLSTCTNTSDSKRYVLHAVSTEV